VANAFIEKAKSLWDENTSLGLLKDASIIIFNFVPVFVSKEVLMHDPTNVQSPRPVLTRVLKNPD